MFKNCLNNFLCFAHHFFPCTRHFYLYFCSKVFFPADIDLFISDEREDEIYARSANGIYPVENKHIITVFSLTRLPATITTSPEIPVILWGRARVSPGASGLLIVVKSGK
jgi:hypothetical protein